MLVLSRKVGESIVLPGCDLVITLLQVDPAKVRLGIQAPPDIRVYRLEVWDRIRQEAEAASGSSAAASHAGGKER